MGRFFSSFEEAWAHFETRCSPLESFWDALLDERDAVVHVWLIFPPIEVKTKTRGIQQSFRALDWIAPVPEHFLHVALGEANELEVDQAKRAWLGVEPFELVYRRANCFHDAAIIEVHGEGVPALVERAFPKQDLSLLLPHLSIGYVKQRETVDELRSALSLFRDVDLGRGVVDEVFLCEVPFTRSTFLQPWRVLDSLKLRRRRPL